MPDAPTPVRVFLLDDHEVVRRGLRELLEAAGGIEVVGESGSAREAARRAPALRPHVAIVDARLPDGSGIDACRDIRSVDPSIRDMLGHLIKWTIMGFGLVIACNQIGIQIAALLTGVGIIGLAVGFAAQETLANFIAGVVIFWDKPFRVGDWLELDETYGRVQRVTFRSTRILDINGQVIIYPNTHMLANRVANHTTHPLTRVAVPIEVDVAATLVPQIEQLMASGAKVSNQQYFKAAVFYAENGLDLQKARTWIEAATKNDKPAFYMVHWKARILARLGDKEGAKAAAEQSTKLAVAAEGEQSPFVKMNHDLIASLK